MRTLTLKTATLFFISILLVSTACQKRSEVVAENSTFLKDKVEKAKTWFANSPVLREKEMLNLPYEVLPEKSPKRVFARMGKMQHRLQWENAEHFNRDGVSYLIVPVSLNSKIFGNEYDFAKVVVFNTNRSGQMEANVLEILGKKGTSLGGRQMEIANTAFYNRELNKKESLAGINASIFFYDEMYKKQNGFEVRNGEWAATKNTLVVGKNKQSAANSNYRTTECELWGAYVDHYDANGVLLYSTLLYTYYVGDCDGGSGPDPDPTESGDPNGSGGGSAGGGDNNEDYDVPAEAALQAEVLSTTTPSASTTVSYTSPTEASVPFQWVVVKNTFNLWQVISSDIAKGYNSTNTGAIIYDIQHVGSSITGQTEWGRIPRRPGLPITPLIKLSWAETSATKSIANDYRSGTVTVSGDLKNLGVTFRSPTNSFKVTVQ